MVVLQIGPIHLFFGTDTIDIFFDVGISVARAVAVGVRGVVGVQSVGLLPFVRHTVAVAVNVWSTLVFWVSAHLSDVGDDTIFIRVVL